MPGYATFPESNLSSDLDMFRDKLDILFSVWLDTMVCVFGSDRFQEAWQNRKEQKRRERLRHYRRSLVKKIGHLLSRLNKVSEKMPPHEAYVLRRLKSEYPWFGFDSDGSYWMLTMFPLVFLVKTDQEDEDAPVYFGLLLSDVYNMDLKETRERGWERWDIRSNRNVFKSVIKAFEGRNDFPWFVPYADQVMDLESQVDFLDTWLDQYRRRIRILSTQGNQNENEIRKLQKASRNLFDGCPVDHHAFRKHFFVSCSSCDGTVARKKQRHAFYCSCPFCDEDLACFDPQREPGETVPLLPDLSEDEIAIAAELDAITGVLNDHH